jgi:hypothetical protein
LGRPDQRQIEEPGARRQRRTVGRHGAEPRCAGELKSSFTDSRLDIDVPLARHIISSIGALGFRVGDLSNPKPAKPGDTEVDLTSFTALTTQVDAPAMSDILNTAITTAVGNAPIRGVRAAKTGDAVGFAAGRPRSSLDAVSRRHQHSPASVSRTPGACRSRRAAPLRFPARSEQELDELSRCL